MNDGWTLVEPCCGGAALTLHLCGARRPLLPYQGGKWRWRRELGEVLAEAGFTGVPRRVELTDPSAWGVVAGVVLRASTRAGLIDRMALLARLDARAVYEALQGQPIPEDPVEFAAEHLFLQRLSFSGKAVGTRGGVWRSPGFNVSSAYGVAATERFGDVKPMIPSLLETLRSYASVTEPERLVAVRGGAVGPTGPAERTVVYLDPPYAGSTEYPDARLGRAEVVALARAWAEAGAFVMVSEGEPVAELVATGWSARALYAGRADTSPFRGKQEEWITLSPSVGGGGAGARGRGSFSLDSRCRGAFTSPPGGPMPHDPVLAERVRAAVAQRPGVTEKAMFGGVCWMMHGNMFLGVSREDLMVRFGREQHAELARRPGAREMDHTANRSMPGMLFVGRDGWGDDERFLEWVDLCWTHVQTLPPKAEKVPKAEKKPAKRAAKS